MKLRFAICSRYTLKYLYPLRKAGIQEKTFETELLQLSLPGSDGEDSR